MTDNKWTKFAKIAFPLVSSNKAAQTKAQRDWYAMVAAADEIVEAERKQTAENIIRAGKKRRNEQ